MEREVSPGTWDQVDSPVDIPPGVTVTSNPSAGTPTFTFEGAASEGYTITYAGPDRSYQLTIAAATGMVSITEL